MSSLLLGAWVTRQILFWSVVQGLIFGLLAMGIVLIYRSTRVINFAVGNMGLPGASLFALLMINWGWPFWPALVLSLVVGALLGFVTEVTVVKLSSQDEPLRLDLDDINLQAFTRISNVVSDV